MSELSGQVDLVSPLQVQVHFFPIERRPPSFNGGNPVDLIDYRTIPVLIVEGTTQTSVSGQGFVGTWVGWVLLPA